MTEKLSKSDLRTPDEFENLFGRLLAGLTQHNRAVLYAVSAAVLATAAYLGWQVHQTRLDKKAADDFVKITQTLGESDPAGLDRRLSDLNAFLKNHGSSSLSGTAWVFKGKTLLLLNRPGDALSAYETALKKLPGNYRVLAVEGKADALTELKRWNEAEAIYRDLSGEKDNPLRAENLWKLGLVQEGKGDKGQAIAVYRSFEKEFLSSPLLEKVRARRAALQAK